MKDKMKTGVIAAVTAALLALTITFVMAGGTGRSGGNAGETVLQVSNLSCGACLNTIENELRKNKGMLGMTSDLAAGLITIKHTTEITPERLAELVSGVGYPAKVAAPSTATNQATSGGVPGCRGCGPKGCNLPAPTPSKS